MTMDDKEIRSRDLGNARMKGALDDLVSVSPVEEIDSCVPLITSAP